MELQHLKEHASQTASLIMLVIVIVVSTASVLSLNPRTISDVVGTEGSNDSVKGISTFDTQAVFYEQFIGRVDGVEIQNFRGEGQNYLTKIIIGDTQRSELEQGILKINNNSLKPKKFSLIIRTDPVALRNYIVSLRINENLIPLNFENYGYQESTFEVEASSVESIGIHIRTIGYGNVQNLGFEMELNQI
jgi:hypothetical protein